MRAEAENDYSMKLFKISDRNQLESFKIGLLQKEVESFKANSRCKARASQELSKNIEQDCISPLI